MLNSPQDPREKRKFYQALCNLSAQDGDFYVIMNHFQREAKRIGDENRLTRDETQYKWNQGALQFLGEFEEIVHSARDTLEKLEKQRMLEKQGTF